MPDIYGVVRQFRFDLESRNAEAVAALREGYASALEGITERRALTERLIERLRERGLSTEAALQRDARWQALEREIRDAYEAAAPGAGRAIARMQRAAVAISQLHAARLIAEGLGRVYAGFTRAPLRALESLIGALGDGSPLSRLLLEFGDEGAAAARKAIIQGLAQGQNPRVIARAMARAAGFPAQRAETIARTETLRAYREASRATYKANADVVSGWQWSSGRNKRTCAFCWSQDGLIFTLDEPMPTHPRCRCVQLPVLDIREARGRPSGPQIFSRLKPEAQAEVLGPGKMRLYETGRIGLNDLAGFRDDPRWGRVGYERSIADTLAASGRADRSAA